MSITERVREAMTRRSPTESVADRVEGAVIAASDGRLRDDMAILAFGPTPQPKETDG